MECHFCNKILNQTLGVKYKKKDKDNYGDTVINNNVIRCGKCKKIYCCKDCKECMELHYNNCTSELNPIYHIDVIDNNYDRIDYTYVYMPQELGGTIVDVKTVLYYPNSKLIIFKDCKYALLDENNKYFWIKYNKEIEIYPKKQSIGEKLCSQIISEIYPNNKFIKIRPQWLKNTKTNKPMELDIYCDELKLAIEYNGKQHYEYIEYFHRDEENFKLQCERDLLKNELCKKNDIKLITIPYTYNTYDSIKTYIISELQ